MSPLIFSLDDGADFAALVARRLRLRPGRHEERTFEDGEHKIRPLENVRGRDVYIVQELHGGRSLSGDEKFVRLLFFVGALKDAAAASVTVVAPYLSFLRKDQRTKPRDPVTTRYVAQLFESMGLDAMITVEAHNIAAFQNAFRCETQHLHARSLFTAHALALVGDGPAAVVSPDPGGMKRAELLRQRLETEIGRPVTKGICDKHRSEGAVTGDLFAGDIDGRVAIVVDDMIATGGTLARATALCRANGATAVHVIATHGLFVDGGRAVLDCRDIDSVAVTNSVPPLHLGPEQRKRITVLDISGLVAEAINRHHAGGSISDLLGT